MDKYRKTELSYAFLIQKLYGAQAYREVKDANNLQITKKYYLKIVSSIAYSISETIEITDNSHRESLLNEIDRYKKYVKASTSIVEIGQLMVAFQSTIIFLLLGQLPNRWRSEKFVNKKERWKLDAYRQIHYTQNLLQKRNLIFAALQNKYRDRFDDWGDFVLNIYSTQCENDPK